MSEAIRRELLREGQALYVHNRVKDIEHIAADVRELVPEARVAVAHGQMDEGRLERVVQKFWEHEFDVLVCTTIVESGLDMPTVNTLVVDRADRLGLAQLYQLRGRVGRRGQRAYAYLLYPSDHKLSEEAYERLKTIGEFTDLGSGFKIAMRDLEIRGAGSLLGAEQSGHIAAVGFDLYVEMVTEAVGELTDAPPARSTRCRSTCPSPRTFRATTSRATTCAWRRTAGWPRSLRSRRGRRARRMERPVRTAASAGVGIARRRAPASGMPAFRHTRGLGAEGPGAARRLGTAEVAGGAAAAVVGSRAGSPRRRDRAHCRDRRRVAPAGSAPLAARDRSARVGTLPRMKRLLALFVAASLVALAGSACSSTLSDAATITYKAKGSTHELHVTRDDLLSEVRKIVDNKPFAAWLKQNKFTVTSDLSADSKISAIWLSQLIHEEAIDALFASRHLRVTAAIKKSGRQRRVNRSFRRPRSIRLSTARSAPP